MFFSRFCKYSILFGFILFGAYALSNAAAFAQDSAGAQPPVDVLQPAEAEERGLTYDSDTHTHPPVKLTPDKSELIRLDRPAGSIIVGNPNHLSILADTSRTLVLVARAAGATHFTVLDQSGAVLMQRHVIVASPKEKYLRVRRSCAGSEDDACQQTSVFYCPDMCHEVIMGSAEAESSETVGDEPGSTPGTDPVADPEAENGENGS